jgi:hypothetical protein
MQRGKLAEPGGFPDGVAVVTHPGLLDASEGPRERRTGIMKGHIVSKRIGIDRYRIYTSPNRITQWVFVGSLEKSPSSRVSGDFARP